MELEAAALSGAGAELEHMKFCTVTHVCMSAGDAAKAVGSSTTQDHLLL